MKQAKSIFELNVVNEVASSLSRGMSVSSNPTQPTPASGPRSVLKDSVALSAAFAASMGGKQVNPVALSAIAANSAGGTSLGTLGSIGSAAASTSAFTGPNSSIGSTLGNTSNYWGPNAVGENTLASFANASYAAGSKDLGPPLELSGENALSLSATELSVADIGDPSAIPTNWVFVTAPQDVSWNKEGKVDVMDNFGTNNPYVVYSTTGMRKLTLDNVMIEGFSAGKEVESQVIKLENMMTMVQNTQKGYVSPYVWDLRAGDKSYGLFIIESIQIKEVMRNKKGKADRAFASISLQQVPNFQVNDGRDLATKADLAAGKSVVPKEDKKGDRATSSASGRGGKGQPGSKVTGDPKSPPKTTPNPINPKQDKPLNIDRNPRPVT